MPGTRPTPARRSARQQQAMRDRDRAMRARMQLPDPDRAAFQAVVNRLTNWQRNRWAAAGYPGLHDMLTGPVERYALLRRRP